MSWPDSLQWKVFCSSLTRKQGAGHACSNPSGTNYVEAAAADAWEKAIAFLATHLQATHVH